MVFASTSSCWGASDCLANLNADAVESIADLFGGAVIVALASDGDTNDGGIALHTSRAVALRTMECNTAQRVRAALVSAEDAGIQTLSSDTSSIRWAVVVTFTFS